MNRRELFLSSAKAALLTAVGSSWLMNGARADAETPSSGMPNKQPENAGSAVGSPDGTRTIPGDVLPPPDLPFGGTTGLNAAQSRSWWQPRVVPPAGAPNILLIMTDDVGFAAPSTFGGVIPTPALDRIASDGLRYTNFHSTSLCSPTRAALMTGRNHHSAGFGVVSEAASGFPGYNSTIGKDCTTMGRILREQRLPHILVWQEPQHADLTASQAGPFDQWPIGMGFEYFYGFVGGETSQWHPNLFRNTTAIHPYVGKPGWNLTTAMADEAVSWMNQLNDIDPTMPFFMYYVPGGTHSRISRHPSGSRRSATCTCSTKGGMRFATRSSPIRSGSASSRKTRS